MSKETRLWTKIWENNLFRVETILFLTDCVIAIFLYKNICNQLNVAWIFPFILVISIFGRRYVLNHMSHGFDYTPTSTKGLWTIFILCSFICFLQSSELLFLLNILNIDVTYIKQLLSNYFLLPEAWIGLSIMHDIWSNGLKGEGYLCKRQTLGGEWSYGWDSKSNSYNTDNTNVDPLAGSSRNAGIGNSSNTQGGYHNTSNNTAQPNYYSSLFHAEEIKRCSENIKRVLDESGIRTITDDFNKTVDAIKDSSRPQTYLIYRYWVQKSELTNCVKSLDEVIALPYNNIPVRVGIWQRNNGQYFAGPSNMVQTSVGFFEVAKGVGVQAKLSLDIGRTVEEKIKSNNAT